MAETVSFSSRLGRQILRMRTRLQAHVYLALEIEVWLGVRSKPTTQAAVDSRGCRRLRGSALQSCGEEVRSDQVGLERRRDGK